MYCSSCGTAATPGLSYCSRCGAELSTKRRTTSKPTEASPDSLVWGIVSVTVGGLGAIMVLIAVMKEVFSKELLFVFTLLSFLVLLAAEGMLVRLLLRRQGGVKEEGDTARLKEQTTRDLGEAQARVLPEGAPSVIEHATHTFEPAYGKRKTE